MFYIVQPIKRKSLTKDLDSPWTSALHGQKSDALLLRLFPRPQLPNALFTAQKLLIHRTLRIFNARVKGDFKSCHR